MKKRVLAALILMVGLLMPALIPTDLPADVSTLTVRRVHPNPFREGTTFQLTMPRDGKIRIAVHDLLGNPIQVLREGLHTAGKFDIYWDGKDASGMPVIPGIYICSLFSDDSFVTSVKVVKVQS